MRKAKTLFVSMLVAGMAFSTLTGCEALHKHTYKDEVVAPTCQKQGYTLHTCECGDTYTDSITPKTDHHFVDVVDTEATCTTAGVMHKECEWCHEIGESNLPIEVVPHEYVEVVDVQPTCVAYGTGHMECQWCQAVGDTYTIDKAPHDYADHVVAATCERGGYTEHTCVICGDSYRDAETDALGHTYVTTVVEATCTDGGYTIDTCSSCKKEVRRDATAPLGHNYVKVEEIPATTTSKGKITYRCSRCPSSYTEETPVLPTEEHTHSWNDGVITVNPTCTNMGTKVFSCDCGASYTQSIPATGHDYKATKVEPTCTEQGYTKHRCNRCGNEYKDEYVSALGHNYVLTVQEATCTESGLKTWTCTRCGVQYTEEILAKGHEYKDGFCTNCGEEEPHTHTYSSVLTKPATCAEDGVRTYTCSGCGDQYTEAIPKTNNHSYTVVVTEPTCTAGGYTTHTCSICGDSKRDAETAALGHQWGEGKVTKEPTCAEEGVRTYTCSVCGEQRTEAIAKTAHSYTAVVTEPTCTEGGYTTYTCTICGYSYRGDERSALDHDWDVGVVTKEPTCTEKGVKTYTCTRDGSHTRTEEISMKSHTFVDGICSVCGAEKAHEHEKTKLIAQSAATCTTDGFMRYKCSCGYVFEEVIPSRGGHDWYLYGTEEPSCIDGYELYFCEYCGASYQKDLPATGEHRWGVIQSHSATCTAPSYDECECMVCHEKMNSEDGPALGHDYKGDCARKECTRCGDVITGRHDFKITETHFIYSFSNTDYVWVDTVDYDCSICGRGVIFYGGCESEELANDGIANKGCWIYKGTLCKTEKEFALLIKEYG